MQALTLPPEIAWEIALLILLAMFVGWAVLGILDWIFQTKPPEE